MRLCLAKVRLSPSTALHCFCPKVTSTEPGRPIFDTAVLLEDLLGFGFSQTKVVNMLGVSCWAI